MLHILTILSLALGLLAGTGSPGVSTQAGRPDVAAATGGKCPLIYAPVICDNGKTYPNQCVADQHHAQNCVPTGEP